jgi:hypothetical protein
MSAIHPTDQSFFLNRMATFTKQNPWETDPLYAMVFFFDLMQPERYKEKLYTYFMAASGENTFIQKRIPDLIDFFNRLELLTEACFIWLEKEQKINDQKVNDQLKNIFMQMNLGEWKQLLECWRDAALAKYSIVETIEPENILASYIQLCQLIDAAYLLTSQKAVIKNIVEEQTAKYFALKISA